MGQGGVYPLISIRIREPLEHWDIYFPHKMILLLSQYHPSTTNVNELGN